MDRLHQIQLNLAQPGWMVSEEPLLNRKITIMQRHYGECGAA